MGMVMLHIIYLAYLHLCILKRAEVATRDIRDWVDGHIHNGMPSVSTGASYLRMAELLSGRSFPMKVDP